MARVRNNAVLKRLALPAMDAVVWEDVAEYDYQPTKCRKTYRMVVVRKNISKMKVRPDAAGRNPSLLLHHHPEGPERGRPVVRLANARCDQENVIAQLKSGVGALSGSRSTTW